MKTLTVNDIYTNRVLYECTSYNDAWEFIYDREMKQSPCICKNTREQWEESQKLGDTFYLDFDWPEGVDYIWTADWIAEPIIDPDVYDSEGVNFLIDELMLNYIIIEHEDEDECFDKDYYD